MRQERPKARLKITESMDPKLQKAKTVHRKKAHWWRTSPYVSTKTHLPPTHTGQSQKQISYEWQRAVAVFIPKEVNSKDISQFRNIA